MSVREAAKKKKAGLGNYWTRLGSWGNFSGTRSPRWWGYGKRDHMEWGWWLCSPKLVTRLLPSPWAESEMRLARPNVLPMYHLCHKTNLITVNYGAAIIKRGPLPVTQAHRVHRTACTDKLTCTLACESVEWPASKRLDRAEVWGPQGACSQPGQVYFIFMVVILQKNVRVHVCMSVCVQQECGEGTAHGVLDESAYAAQNPPTQFVWPARVCLNESVQVSAAAHGCASLMRRPCYNTASSNESSWACKTHRWHLRY